MKTWFSDVAFANSVIEDLADMSELMTLETEFRAIVASCVNKLATESGATDQAPVSIAIEHARRSIEERKVALGANAGSESRGEPCRRLARQGKDRSRCLKSGTAQFERQMAACAIAHHRGR
jgi:hypothetical protein